MIKRFGIFTKVFAYTTLFLLAVIAVAIGLFYQQFAAFYNAQQRQQLMTNYHALVQDLQGADRQQMVEIAQRFFDGNQTFVFRLLDAGENVLFDTPNIRLIGDDAQNTLFINVGGYTLIASSPTPALGDGEFLRTAALGLAAIMVIALAGAAIFAKQMTNPIKHLVSDTKQMEKLLPIEPPKKRNDEIGDLAGVVHSMYGKLKDTIMKLEDEILRRNEMEEAQRYFFSAASHELKTPIAAARVVMEGMLADIGDYKDHPKYIRECIKLMDEQSKTIYEILALVSLDEQYNPVPEAVNIKEIAETGARACKPLAETNGQHIGIDIPENFNGTADARLLKKVISNILLNAVQNCPQDGQIRMYAEDAPAGIRLCIANTGHIDDELLPRLFEPFYRADKARSRKSGKTGLGLTIVKKSLDIMGAEFGIENDGECVLFWMVLPKG